MRDRQHCLQWCDLNMHFCGSDQTCEGEGADAVCVSTSNEVPASPAPSTAVKLPATQAPPLTTGGGQAGSTTAAMAAAAAFALAGESAGWLGMAPQQAHPPRASP